MQTAALDILLKELKPYIENLFAEAAVIKIVTKEEFIIKLNSSDKALTEAVHKIAEKYRNVSVEYVKIIHSLYLPNNPIVSWKQKS